MTHTLHDLAKELPSVEAAAAEGHKLFHLVVLALFERGAPMTLSELVERLAPVVDPASGDLAMSIQKAWHGLHPVLRGRDGRFTLDHDERELKMALVGMDLWRPSRAGPAAQEPPQVRERADTDPLTAEELEAAFAGNTAWRSAAREIASVLDANGRPMTLAEVDAHLQKLVGSPCRSHLPPASGHSIAKLILQSEDEFLRLDHESEALPAMRRAVRKAAHTVLETRTRAARTAEEMRAHQIASETREREAVARLATLSRALLRVFPGPEVQAATLIDTQDRTIRTFVGDVSELPDALRRYQVLVGIGLRDALAALQLDPTRWQLVELDPPRKTRKLNKSGRTLKITTPMLISSSVGISRAIGDPKQTAAWLAAGDHGKVTRRLESDAKHLYAYWRYGALHGSVRLLWGFLDEALAVDWRMPGEPSLYSVLAQARKENRAVDLVLGRSAPGWSDPWSRARRVRVVDHGPWEVTVNDGTESLHIPSCEVQAVRLA